MMTLAAVFALAAGIPLGLAPLHLADAFEAPIPEDSGDRIRGLQYSDLASSQRVAPTYFEYARWSDELTTFEAIGAARTGNHNLPSQGGGGAPVLGAEVTASTFQILRAVPLLGRPLNRGDEIEGAPDVVVVGYDLWRARLGGDPEVIGTTLRVGRVPRTIVGVMPE